MQHIDFGLATDLTKAVAWVYDPDKELTPSCALRYVYLQQTDNSRCGVLGYAVGDVWLYQSCPAQGILGLDFLFDPEDLLDRIGKKDGFKDASMRISPTKETKMKVEAIMRIVDDKVESAGNILIPTYGGDMADFEIPEEDWHLLGRIYNGYRYRNLCRLLTSFSGLRSVDEKQAVWFSMQYRDNNQDLLSITSTERGGRQGSAMIAAELLAPDLPDFQSFGIPARFLQKTSEVFERDETISVYVNEEGDFTRVKFEGDKGWVSLPIIDGYFCQAVSEGAMAFFYNQGLELEAVCDRTFNLPQLSRGLDIQIHKKNSTAHRSRDRLLEMVGEQLVISKRSDLLKKELSTIPCWTLEGAGDWTPLVADHDYLDTALETLDKFITQGYKDRAAEPGYGIPTDFDTDESEDTPLLGTDEEENRKQLLKHKLVRLTQKRVVHEDGVTQWFLFLDSPDFAGCQILIICATAAETTDFVEAD